MARDSGMGKTGAKARGRRDGPAPSRKSNRDEVTRVKPIGKDKSPAVPAGPRPRVVDWPSLIQALSRIVGPKNVHSRDAVCVAYACSLGAPQAVVLPRTLDELARVSDACRRAGVAMDTIWGKQLEKDVLLVDGVVVDTRMLARSNPPSVVWNYTHYGEPSISYREWEVR